MSLAETGCLLSSPRRCFADCSLRRCSQHLLLEEYLVLFIPLPEILIDRLLRVLHSHPSHDIVMEYSTLFLVAALSTP